MGLGRGPGRGRLVHEGGGFLCRKGVLGGFLGWILCRKGGGFLCKKAVLGGFLGRFLCRKGGIPEWGAHATAHTLCRVRALKQPSPCGATTADPWQRVLTIYLPHCIVSPSNQRPSDSKGTKCQPAGMPTKRLARVPPWCCERSPRPPQQARVHGFGLGWCHLAIRYTKTPLLSSVPRANPPKRPFTTTGMLPCGVTNKACCSDLGQGSHSLWCACPASGQSSDLGVVSAGITCGEAAAS